jgi:diphosphomevalonate decarboxylase
MQATAVAHPNVALIKYWGKRDSARNLPAVGSLSLTLGGLHTRTTVTFDEGLAEDEVLINRQPDEQARPRVSRCLDMLRAQAGVQINARVESENDFPTGAGLASSASGYAALVKAAAGALNLDASAAMLNEVARIGSGSAPRSLHGGIVLLDIADAAQESAEMRCETICAPNDWPLSVVVAVTSHAAKDVGSTGGMELSRSTSPYYEPWVETHPQDLRAGLEAVAARDFMTLAELSEHSCLKMHAVAMTTRPALFYWSAATVECLLAVRRLRAEGVPVFFTIDAGPQLKAVCLPEAADQVAEALGALPGVLEIIGSQLGPGAWLES